MGVEFVNGYPCRDCTEVDLAKKGIDPAHPKDGPYGRDKLDLEKKPTRDLSTAQPVLASEGDLGRKLDVRV